MMSSDRRAAMHTHTYIIPYTGRIIADTVIMRNGKGKGHMECESREGERTSERRMFDALFVIHVPHT